MICNVLSDPLSTTFHQHMLGFKHHLLIYVFRHHAINTDLPDHRR